MGVKLTNDLENCHLLMPFYQDLKCKYHQLRGIKDTFTAVNTLFVDLNNG